MADIPIEAKELASNFLRQQEEAKAQRTAVKAEKNSGKEIRSSQEPSRHMTASEMESYARKFGFVLETGGGRHGKHLIAPDQRAVSLPDHGGGKTLAIGTQRAITEFIHQHGVSKN